MKGIGVTATIPGSSARAVGNPRYAGCAGRTMKTLRQRNSLLRSAAKGVDSG